MTRVTPASQEGPAKHARSSVSGVRVPPVIVFGDGVTALGVLRVFGRRGIPVQAAGPGHDCISDSRWYRPAAFPAPSEPSPSALVDYLERLPVEDAVLLACEDDWARCLAAARSDLEERFHTALPAAAVLENLMDKWSLAGTLRDSDVPHPETRLIRSPEDFDEIPEGRLTSAFLKPLNSQLFYDRFDVKAFGIRSREDARQKLALSNAAGIPQMLLQDYIPGPPTNHYFLDGYVDAEGAVSAVFARRRHRMYPHDFGNSTYMVSVPIREVDAARDALERLLHHVEYRGIFSAEFKRDARDGVLKLLEVNVRPWWYVEFTARCGVDVCWLAYNDALGRSVEPIREYTIGKSLVYTYYDLFAARSAWRERSLSFWEWTRSWLVSQRPLFCLDDPRPGTVQSMRFISEQVTKLLRRPLRR